MEDARRTSAPPSPSLEPLAEAARRLAAARARQVWLRAALWVWWAATIAWLMPLGPWSATALPLGAAIADGALISLCGAALLWLHHAAIDVQAVRSALKLPSPRDASETGGRIC